MPDSGKHPPGVAHALALVGSLGLVLVVPVLAGVIAGAALDRALGSGGVATLLGALGGIAAGFYTAWRLIMRILQPPE